MQDREGGLIINGLMIDDRRQHGAASKRVDQPGPAEVDR